MADSEQDWEGPKCSVILVQAFTYLSQQVPFRQMMSAAGVSSQKEEVLSVSFATELSLHIALLSCLLPQPVAASSQLPCTFPSLQFFFPQASFQDEDIVATVGPGGWRISSGHSADTRPLTLPAVQLHG